jgi:hypothetical protein
MKWENFGLLYKPESNFDWMSSHATLPTVLQTDAHNFKIFYSTRDISGRSHTTYVDLNFLKWRPGILLKNKRKLPCFSPGLMGHFDDSGVQVSSFARTGKVLYAYYLGWTRKVNVPFSAEIGIAIVDDCYNFKRVQKLPIYKKSELEPLTFGYPTIFRRNNTNFMYYDGIDEWNENNLDDYKFDLRMAVMQKGTWVYSDKIVFDNNNYKSITRPSFIKLQNELIMIYSCNTYGKYQLQAAYQSKSKKNLWIRKKNFIFDSSSQEWDSEEQVFCNIFKYHKDYYMVYNGNNYGKTGFGISKLLCY